MRICVTGSTGFVGQGVVPALLEAGFEVHALARGASISKIPTHKNSTTFAGEALEVGSVANALKGCDALVHLLGARRKQLKASGLTYEDVDVGSVRVALDAMKECGVRRIILLSAGAIGDSVYVQSKAKVEELVKSAGVDWTILRPSFIIGPGQQWPILMTPILSLSSIIPGRIGNVARRARNITREQLAKCVLWTLMHAESVGKIIEVEAIRRHAKEFTPHPSLSVQG